MEQSQGSDPETVSGTRRYQSPHRVLARFFRMGRDGWKAKHHQVQAKLEQERQLSVERLRSRDEWRRKCEAAMTNTRAAEVLAKQHEQELAQVRARVTELETALSKKNGRRSVAWTVRRPAEARRP